MEATRESVWQVAAWWHQAALKILTGGRPVKLAYWLRWRQLLGFLTRQADILFPNPRRTRGTGRQLRNPALRDCLGGTELGVWALDADTLNYLEIRLQRERPRVILECGCGASTMLLSLYARSLAAGEATIISLEQSPAYLESVRGRLAEVGLDAPVHLRLLHHDFGDPRPVRRVVGPPRQRAAVLGEPAEQVFSEKRKALCIVHGKGGCMLEPGELL